MAADTNKAYNRTKSSRTKGSTGSCDNFSKGLPKLTTELRRFEKERYGESTPLFGCCAPFMIWPLRRAATPGDLQGQIYGVADCRLGNWNGVCTTCKLIARSPAYRKSPGLPNFPCFPIPSASALDKSAFCFRTAAWSNYSCTLASESPNLSMRAIC